MYKTSPIILSICLLTGSALATSLPLAKSGIYTMSATVLAASSATACPYGVGASSTDMAGYTPFPGFQLSGNAITTKLDWVIGISPNSGQPKFGYDLRKSTAIAGSSVKFEGEAIYGGANGQFSGKHGVYKLWVNPTTLASTLTVKDDNCIITYSLSFTRSIPSKFLNLL